MNRLLASVPITWTNPINVIIGVLENALGFTLAAIYSVIPSYGVAIIILTLLIRLALYPIMSRSTRSMRKMQQLQPHVKKLQEKYKNDRQKLSEEQMALFKANNVSPISGCLPLLIQMPILLAMFRVINGARGGGDLGVPSTTYLPPNSDLTADLQHVTLENPGAAMFLGMDLALTPFQAVSEFGILPAIPYFIVVALIVLTGWYQQKQIQARNDASKSQQDVPQAMRTMTRIFPIFFGLISLSLPAGVNIYFLTSNLFQVGQQYLIIRRSGDEDNLVLPAETAKKAPRGEGRGRATGGRTTTSGPARSTGKGKSGSGKATGGDVEGPKKRVPKKVAPKAKRQLADGGSGGGDSGGSRPDAPQRKRKRG
ncbi:MAG: YidC/Oxa1 family membrane protein insertase [Acidimicrobiia bacterium]|nr:YidC/Oxa1 family membrane protein insertase [Acidimicrobiia bacterium]